MSIRTKAEIIKGIKKNYRLVNGKAYETWEIYFGMDEAGKKIRTVKPTKQEAIAHVEAYFKALDAKVSNQVSLTPKDVLDAWEARDMLIAAGLGKVTLRQCAREFIGRESGKSVNDAGSYMTVDQAFCLYLNSIPSECEAQRKCVSQRVGKWAESLGKGYLMRDVTLKDVSEYAATVGNAVKTRNNVRGYIKSFLAWCADGERLLIAVNPCASLKSEKEPYKEPLFISVADMETLAREVERSHPAALPFLVLSYWCGIRSAEIDRLRECPEDIRYEEQTVRISKVKGWTRGMKPRVVHIEDNAVAWMRKIGIREALPKMTVESMRNAVYFAASAVGVRLGHNTGRHSYITYLSAKTGNPRFAETMAGTSDGMRTKSYDGLATKSAGEAYFSIMPS